MVTSVARAESLRKWNLWAAGLYAAQAIVLALLGARHVVAVNAGYVTKDSLQSQVTGHTVLAPASHQLFEANVVWLVVAALLVGALMRAVMALGYRQRYEAELRNGQSRLRWIEFAISSSILLVIIGLLVGMQDLGSLILLVGLLVASNLCGLAMEVYNPWRRTMQVKWLGYVIGAGAALLAWLILGGYVVAAGIYGNGLPGYLYVLAPTAFLAYAALSANTLLQYKRRGRWADYYFSERVYLVLAVITSALVAWQVFAGALR